MKQKPLFFIFIMVLNACGGQEEFPQAENLQVCEPFYNQSCITYDNLKGTKECRYDGESWGPCIPLETPLCDKLPSGLYSYEVSLREKQCPVVMFDDLSIKTKLYFSKNKEILTCGRHKETYYYFDGGFHCDLFTILKAITLPWGIYGIYEEYAICLEGRFGDWLISEKGKCKNTYDFFLEPDPSVPAQYYAESATSTSPEIHSLKELFSKIE